MKSARASIYSRTLLWWLGLAITIAVASMMSGCQDSKNLLYYDPNDSHKTPIVESSSKVSEVLDAAGVDILFVVDNSGSMGDYQKELSANAQLFMNELTQNIRQIPWRMGLISTDIGNAPFIGLAPRVELTSKTANPVGIFTSAISRLGTGGSAQERSFAPIVSFAKNNPAFFTPSSALAMVIVTDAPEQSYQTGMDLGSFLTEMRKIKGSDPKKLLAYGAFATTDHCGTSDDGWDWMGSTYESLITQLSGSNFWLCSPTFGTDLAAIFKDIVRRVNYPQFFLKQRPRVETLKIKYHGIFLPPVGESAGVWIYDAENNAIVFTDMSAFPDLNSSVDVTYAVDDGLPYRP